MNVSAQPLGSLRPGDLGLIEAESIGRALAMSWTGADGERQALLITQDKFNYQNRPSNVLILEQDHFEYWPDVLVFSDGRIDPDPLSAYCQFEEMKFSVLPNSFGGLYIYVVDSTIYGRRLRIDVSDGKLVKAEPRSAYWGFSRWTFSVPDPLRADERQPVFTFDASPKPT